MKHLALLAVLAILSVPIFFLPLTKSDCAGCAKDGYRPCSARAGGCKVGCDPCAQADKCCCWHADRCACKDPARR